MLVQSHEDCYELLPALPSAWKTGFVKGLNLRGGAVLDMSWKGGKLSEALIMPRFDVARLIKYGNTVLHAELKAGVPYNIKG
jgi:alpha-L-fucosidase 2